MEKKNEKISEKKKFKLSKKHLIIIGVIIIVIILVMLLITLLGKGDINKNKTVVNEEVVINVGAYDQFLVIKTLEKNVKVDDKVYARLWFEFKNNKDKDVETSLHEYELLDTYNRELAKCYNDGTLPNSGLKNILPSVLKANSTTSGYLYCPTEEEDIAKIKISAIKGGKLDDPNSYEYEYYYVKLVHEEQ